MVVRVLAAVISVLVASYVFHILQRKRRHLPPGPRSYPLVGQLLSAPLSFEHLGYKRISEQLKSDVICLEFLGNTIVVLHSAQSANDLLDKCSSIYSDRTCSIMLSHEKLLNWSNGLLFTGYGERFRAHRRIMNAWLNKGVSIAFHERQVFHSRQLLNRLLRFDNQITPSEVLETEFYRLTATSITGAVYGYEVSSLEDPFVARSKQVTDILGQSVLPTHFLVNAMPFLAHIPDWIHINEMARGTAQPSILRSELEEYEAMGKTVSDVERDNIQQVCSSLFAAGSDTTAGALTAFMIAMLLFPETQSKAQAEIDRVVGADRLPEMSDLPQLPYLANLVQELLRWQPVLPLGVPHTCAQDNVYKGYSIPKGAIVIGNIWAMTRDESVYENPEMFNPDRFLDTSVPPAPTFGWGRRKCPGIHYAESLLSISIASILATFNIKRAKDASGRDIIPSTEGYPAALIYRPQPFPCVLSPRSERHRRLAAELTS